MATLDLFAEHEGAPAGAVIGARAVVLHAPPKFREQQHDDIVGLVVLAQIGHERLNALAHGAPQIAVTGVLPGMRVEGAVVAVEDAAADLGDMHLRDALPLAGDRRGRIPPRRGIFLWRDLDDVLAFQRIDRRLAQIIHDRAATDRRAVHIGEAVEYMRPLIALHLRQEAVALERTGDAGHRHAGADQRAWQARPHADHLHDVFLVRVEFAGNAPEPSLGPDLFRLASVPDVHRPEMRTRRILKADAVQHRKLVFIPELFH